MAKYVKEKALYYFHLSDGFMGIVRAQNLSSAKSKITADATSRKADVSGLTIRLATQADIAYFTSMGGAIW
jgi:hypothetical protein